VEEALISMNSRSVEMNLKIDVGMGRGPMIFHWAELVCMYIDKNYSPLPLVVKKIALTQ
jgi:hypothetical protein